MSGAFPVLISNISLEMNICHSVFESECVCNVHWMGLVYYLLAFPRDNFADITCANAPCDFHFGFTAIQWNLMRQSSQTVSHPTKRCNLKVNLIFTSLGDNLEMSLNRYHYHFGNIFTSFLFPIYVHWFLLLLPGRGRERARTSEKERDLVGEQCCSLNTNKNSGSW